MEPASTSALSLSVDYPDREGVIRRHNRAADHALILTSHRYPPFRLAA
jgi:hypothetical protein